MVDHVQGLSTAVSKQDLPFLFGQVLTKSQKSKVRSTEILQVQKNRLKMYLLTLAEHFTKLNQHGIFFTRHPGKLRKIEEQRSDSRLLSVYSKCFYEARDAGQLAYLIRLQIKDDLSVEEQIDELLDTCIFSNSAAFSDFNWYYLEATESFVENLRLDVQKGAGTNWSNIFSQPKYVNHTMSNAAFDGGIKVYPYIDIDLKDQYSIYKDILEGQYGFAISEELFQKMCTNPVLKDQSGTRIGMSPEYKLKLIQNSTTYKAVTDLHPYDIVFTGNGIHISFLTKMRQNKNNTSETFKTNILGMFSKLRAHWDKNNSQPWVLDQKCVNAARLKRLPFTYNFKPDKQDSILAATLCSVPFYLPSQISLEEKQPFELAVSFTKNLEKERESNAAREKVLDQEVKSYSSGKGQFHLKHILLNKKPMLFSMLRRRLTQDKKRSSELWDKPTLGEVLDYLKIPRSKLGYKPSPPGVRDFESMYSPFRCKLGPKDKLNESEETEPSFRYCDNNGLSYDFGIIPTLQVDTSFDIFALMYLLKCKVSGADYLPSSFSDKEFDIIEKMLVEMFQLDSFNCLDDECTIPTLPLVSDKSKPTLEKNPHRLKAIVFNHLFKNYAFVYDPEADCFLVRPKNDKTATYRHIDDPRSCIFDSIFSNLTHFSSTATPQSEISLCENLTHRFDSGDTGFANIAEVSKQVAEYYRLFLNPSRYKSNPKLEVKSDQDASKDTPEQKYFEVTPFDLGTDKKTSVFKYKKAIRIPHISLDSVLLKFTDNKFFSVNDAKLISPDVIETDYMSSKIISIDIPYPEKSFNEYKHEKLYTLLDGLFNLSSKHNSHELLLQYFLATIFVKPNGDSRAVVIVDPGGSGKSTFLDVIKGITEEEFSTEISLNYLDENGETGGSNAALSARAQLRGKHTAIISDLTRYSIPLDIKKYITGDTGSISAKLLFQDSIKVSPQLNFIMMGNTLPRINKDYKALARRLLIMRTSKGVDKAKGTISNLNKKILDEEKPALIRYLLDSITKFKKYGFRFPDDKNSQEYTCDPVAKRISRKSCELIQESVHMRGMMSVFEYAPGRLFNIKAYATRFFSCINSIVSPTAQKAYSIPDITKFITEMIEYSMLFSDELSHTHFDEKQKNAYDYPEEAPLLPIIFVKNPAGETTHAINLGVKYQELLFDDNKLKDIAKMCENKDIKNILSFVAKQTSTKTKGFDSRYEFESPFKEGDFINSFKIVEKLRELKSFYVKDIRSTAAPVKSMPKKQNKLKRAKDIGQTDSGKTNSSKKNVVGSCTPVF